MARKFVLIAIGLALVLAYGYFSVLIRAQKDSNTGDQLEELIEFSNKEGVFSGKSRDGKIVYNIHYSPLSNNNFLHFIEIMRAAERGRGVAKRMFPELFIDKPAVIDIKIDPVLGWSGFRGESKCKRKGVYEMKLTRLNKEDDPAVWYSTAAHEAAHIFLGDTENKTPQGVREGTAILIQGIAYPKISLSKVDLERFLKRAGPRPRHNARQLLVTEDESEPMHYDAASIIFYLLVEHGGIDKLAQFRSLARKKSYESAFKEVYGLSLEKLDKQWREWLDVNWWKERSELNEMLQRALGKKQGF